VSKQLTTAAAIAALLAGIAMSIPAAAQTAQPTIFTTTDFRQDKDRWTDPAYYRNNTPGQLRGMAINVEGRRTGQEASARVYGSQGTGRPDAANFKSPYPYTNAWDHYQALLKQFNGGTKHTRTTLPDWSGHWGGGAQLGGSGAPASSIAAMLTPKYRETFVQEMKAATEGRIWSANSICLPGGYFDALGAEEFVVTLGRVYTLGSGNGSTTARWIYTDGTPHSPKDKEFVKWHGESIGFWNGDELIVHTNQIHGWKGGLSEFSDQLETVERYRLVGDRLEGEVTLYDPEVYVSPINARLQFQRDKETAYEDRMQFNTCTDTNGPSPNVYMDDKGLLNTRTPGDPLYWEPADTRPWATYLNESDKRSKASGLTRIPRTGTPIKK
jgi:hypothetical protein